MLAAQVDDVGARAEEENRQGHDAQDSEPDDVLVDGLDLVVDGALRDEDLTVEVVVHVLDLLAERGDLLQRCCRRRFRLTIPAYECMHRGR